MKRKAFSISLLIALIITTLTIYLISKSRIEDLKGSSFRIGREAQTPSANLMGRDKSILGFSDELFEEIARRRHVEFAMVGAPKDRLFLALRNEEIDALFTPVTERWNSFGVYHFSHPFLALGPVLLLREGEEFTSIRSLEGKTVGIERGSSLLTKLHKLPDLRIAPLSNMFTGLENLAQNKIDALIIDAIGAYIFVNGLYKGKLKILSPSLTQFGFKLISLKTARGGYLIDLFNQGLVEMIEDGSYEKLLSKYSFTNYPLPNFSSSAID